MSRCIAEPPGPPERVHILEVGSRWLSVGWAAPATQVEPLAHYLLQFMTTHDDGTGEPQEGVWQNVTVPGTALSARLVHLTPAVTYRIRVFAVNDLGPGPASNQAAAQTMQEGESKGWWLQG